MCARRIIFTFRSVESTGVWYFVPGLPPLQTLQGVLLSALLMLTLGIPCMFTRSSGVGQPRNSPGLHGVAQQRSLWLEPLLFSTATSGKGTTLCCSVHQGQRLLRIQWTRSLRSSALAQSCSCRHWGWRGPPSRHHQYLHSESCWASSWQQRTSPLSSGRIAYLHFKHRIEARLRPLSELRLWEPDQPRSQWGGGCWALALTAFS
mmetsp:Transcript_63242/g.137565  ORF Transcript_63242/g.137565 Transcript_63242/m.137565 type:complete len:205 (-) Transcript_63242:402-1016(-)